MLLFLKLAYLLIIFILILFETYLSPIKFASLILYFIEFLNTIENEIEITSSIIDETDAIWILPSLTARYTYSSSVPPPFSKATDGLLLNSARGKTFIAPIIPIVIRKLRVLLTDGSVIEKNCLIGPAPSIEADLYKFLLTPSIAVVRINTLKAIPLQVP